MQRRICTSMRNFYWPVAKASFRVGLTHDFALTDKLSIIPNVWLDGGVTGYCVLDPDVRDELRDNPSEEAKHLYAVATCGVKVSF